MTITHKLTQHYAVTTPPRYLTTGNACKSRFIVIIPFPLTAPIPNQLPSPCKLLLSFFSAVRKIFPDKKNKQIERISRVAQLTLCARLIRRINLNSSHGNDYVLADTTITTTRQQQSRSAFVQSINQSIRRGLE